MSPTQTIMFGAVAGSTPNVITGNAIGVSLSNAQVIDQQVTANTVGLSGSGIDRRFGPVRTEPHHL